MLNKGSKTNYYRDDFGREKHALIVSVIFEVLVCVFKIRPGIFALDEELFIKMFKTKRLNRNSKAI